MKPPRWLCLVALAVLLFQTTGCYSYRSLSGPSPNILREVRVTTKSGEVIQLTQVQFDSLTVRGNVREMTRRTDRIAGVLTSVRIPVERWVEIPTLDLVKVEERRFSAIRTVPLAVLGLALAGFGAIGIAYSGGRE